MQIIITREDKRPHRTSWPILKPREPGQQPEVQPRRNVSRRKHALFLSLFVSLFPPVLFFLLPDSAPQPRFLISRTCARACDLTWPSDGVSWISASPNRYRDVRQRSWFLFLFFFWKIFRGFSVSYVDSYGNIMLQYYVLIRRYYNIILYCNTLL